MSQMKRCLGLIGVALAAWPAVAATFSVDSVKQRYPWNGLVDIDYTVNYADGEQTLDASKARLDVKVVDEGVTPATTTTAGAFDVMPLPLAAGRHRVTWDATADGVTAVSDKCRFSLSISTYPVKYLVIDVSGGHLAPKYDVTYLDEPPPGGFNTDEYKTRKLVFRLIPAGGFIMGSPAEEPGRKSAQERQHPVMITKPFYLQMFEFTNGQYEMMAGRSSFDKTGYGAKRPLANIISTDFRGEGTTPTGFKPIGELRSKTGLSLELPTEAQWEWACRAGSAAPYPDGAVCRSVAELEEHAKKYARCKAVAAADKSGHPNYHTEVGSYEPNAWGLYDMQGNVWECTRDKYVEDLAALGLAVDPCVTSSSHDRTIRGGGYAQDAANCRAAVRSYQSERVAAVDIGFRLIVQVP